MGVHDNAGWVFMMGQNMHACHDLLNRFGQDRDVIVFSDMDPKGLEIALTIPNANYWLGPETEIWIDCLRSRQASHSGYDIQSKAMQYLLKRGVAIFAKACFGHPSPSKRQKLNATAMPSAPRFVLVTTSRPNRGSEHWLQMT